ncbi:polysaccharide pyruvyl transferase family protein [Rosistilla oblonga]|uniref:Polysaccharide pyruvyl transferase n=1 Tax=Rosistilla oblonga TaxID=2527990 RepID=A0A518IM06_9BACT|nr:polysaccharide pyruvyl transferase family protein [Rosistilla oblonga]QDV54117.1 Polysaccharide pyruvyl transferase [Rosistilla oblonga]
MNNNLFNRRDALAMLGLATAGAAMAADDSAAPTNAKKKILLRSSWQTVNIGDIAHTPGVLQILRTHMPDAEITLWPSRVDNGVEELLRAEFPKLKIIKTAAQRKQAFEECEFLLHGSGPSLVAQKDVIRWRDETQKPYGVYGITLPSKGSASTKPTTEPAMAKTIEVLSGAEFVFFRDSHSLALAKEKGCQSKIMEFGPDGAFACDLREPEKANAFLKENDLQPGKFLCCIPRLRYTPYWTIKDRPFDEVKHARNEAMKEHDHAQLRRAIVEVVKTTDLKVLVCPEDQTQMKVGKELLVDPLPAEICKRVVWRPNYWLTGEAVSTYVQSAGLFGNEMHSPIMCIGHGIPAIVCRWAEQTSKGYMWEDIGLGQWLFDLDNPADMPKIVPAVLEMAQNPDKAKQIAAAGRKVVERRQAETMAVLKRSLA